jgi:transposase-like protein
MRNRIAVKHIHEPRVRGHQEGHRVIKKGFFRRSSDGRLVQRFFCKDCKRSFSKQTFSRFYRQRKIWISAELAKLITSGVSRRRCALLLGVNRKTIDHKITELSEYAQHWQSEVLQQRKTFSSIHFDDLESFEHTKMKPLSVPLVVEDKSRIIIAAGVAQMPAKGLLAKRSVKKYGHRKDLRPQAWNAVLAVAKAFADPNCHILSDNNPHYPQHIKRHFPNSVHATTPGGRGCIAGYGELKKKGYDPMFSLNHTCASLRDNLACLKRRTWTTTKKPSELQKLLNIAVMSHNKRILAKQGCTIRMKPMTRAFLDLR